jgi:hypothetical protein
MVDNPKSMIERVANAIDSCSEWPALTYRERQARAVIEAMREPTSSMSWMGVRVNLTIECIGKEMDSRCLNSEECDVIGFSDIYAGNPSHWARPIWRAMIDAALKDDN